jgi:hypothetical protein
MPPKSPAPLSPSATLQDLGLHTETSTCPSFWAACPRWGQGHGNEGAYDIQKDETRRLCWSVSALAASYSLYAHNLNLPYNKLYGPFLSPSFSLSFEGS